MSSGVATPRLLLFMREAWKNIRAAPVLMAVAVLTIAVSLILVGFFGFVLVNADRLLDAIAQDLRITVQLEDGLPDERVDALMGELAGRTEVAEVTFLTADEDRERNKALLSEELLRGLDDEAVPASDVIEVQLGPRQRTRDDFARISAWMEELGGVAGVQQLYFGADKVRILLAIIDLIRVIGLIICIIVLAAAVFFTFSTIKLAVYARRDEIEVLRLVGATDGFIRAPFYIEGALAGLCGSITALIIVAFIHARILSLAEDEHFLNVRFDLMPGQMIAWILVGGIALGLLGSMFSVGRYLRT